MGRQDSDVFIHPVHHTNRSGRKHLEGEIRTHDSKSQPEPYTQLEEVGHRKMSADFYDFLMSF